MNRKLSRAEAGMIPAIVSAVDWVLPIGELEAGEAYSFGIEESGFPDRPSLRKALLCATKQAGGDFRLVAHDSGYYVVCVEPYQEAPQNAEERERRRLLAMCQVAGGDTSGSLCRRMRPAKPERIKALLEEMAKVGLLRKVVCQNRYNKVTFVRFETV